MPSEKLLILCTGEFSFGQMMSAYIQFYSHNKIQPKVYSNYQQHLHPLAIQVMKEDGIHINQMKYLGISQLKGMKTEVLLSTNNAIHKDKLHLEYNSYKEYDFNEPDSKTVYNDVVENFRKVREEIKRASIETVGQLSRVTT